MLQDLDARHTAAKEATHLYAKPVARREGRPPYGLWAAAGGGVIALAVAGALGWRYWHTAPQPVAQRPAKVVMLPAAPAVPARPSLPAPAATAAPAQAAAPQPAVPAPEAQAMVKTVITTKRLAPPEEKAAAPVRHGKRHHMDAPEMAQPRPAKERTSVAQAGEAAQAPAKPRKGARADRLAAATPDAAASTKAATQGKEESPAQKAESAYRRGLASVREGYAHEAIAAFDEALKANPRHDAARQTLVNLLIENGRADEAMRQLQLGLTLDPRQPAMAMLLARLQIEHGGNGVDTLLRTLPYAGSNAEYRAFLAGALQRQQRHREAVEQYRAALQGAPQNSVWWMGLGISLQAEKRDGEALEAYRKAKGSGALSPELASFVERRIQQLGGA
jgi:MSHA biogenesis protein MshN